MMSTVETTAVMCMASGINLFNVMGKVFLTEIGEMHIAAPSYMWFYPTPV